MYIEEQVADVRAMERATVHILDLGSLGDIDFSQVEETEIITYIYELILRGINSVEAIYLFLDKNGFDVKLTRLHAILERFDGFDGDRSLWRQLPGGLYIPTLTSRHRVG